MTIRRYILAINMNVYESHILFLLMVLICSITQSCKRELPIFKPSDFNAQLVDKSVISGKEEHRVKDFSLINQNGFEITQKDYEGKIYVTDFFFATCLGICPIMTGNMAKIQEEYINDSDIMFLSISVTPEIDSISILKDYANSQGVIDSKWNLTTGNKRHIYKLARESYFAVLEKGDGGPQDFIHTPNFILIDKKKRIRGVYDGTRQDEIVRLISDINVLKK
ncbi:MAG: SCO1 protein [Owenweeksia sp. TMED14]|nr:MAG: SCO1 protein [Owenweeksia sp. TMED14]